MSQLKVTVSSGIADLDRLLGGGIFVGDNVVWYDDAGSLSPVFYLNFIRHSVAENKPLIYVNFDHSIKHLLEVLGPLADSPHLTILDGFTHGKGEGAEIFLKFYHEETPRPACRVIRLAAPQEIEPVGATLYEVHRELAGDVRLVFDSLTGMQALWGDEDKILQFYSRACPRLYELNTIAYWLIEKGAHTHRLRAHLNQITQVAIELSVRRGKTALTVLKAAMHDAERLNAPHPYWSRRQEVTIDAESRTPSAFDLGSRLRVLRTRRGLSQTELARNVGVTPSTISQVEHNQIYPSLPALYKMSEVLDVEMGALFDSGSQVRRPIVFAAGQALPRQAASTGRGAVEIRRRLPPGFEAAADPFWVEMQPGAKVAGHFFQHKGEEVGYLETGELLMRFDAGPQPVHAGDLIYLKRETPSGWENPGREVARLFWINIR